MLFRKDDGFWRERKVAKSRVFRVQGEARILKEVYWRFAHDCPF